MVVRMDDWQKDGYYALPGFYSPDEIAAVSDAQAAAWRENHPRIVVDDMVTGERQKLKDVGDVARRTHRFKLNDLYLELAEVRALAVNERITPILEALLGAPPVLCNSLTFERGSAQPDHVDALYMTPRTPGHLIAVWIALEDCSPDAGPLRYYPGSHRIDQYVFSNGSLHCVPEEMGAWHAYMDRKIAELGVAPVEFAAKKGDAFIWHSYLLHGGSPIRNPELTRRSLVFHYYSQQDCIAHGCEIASSQGGYWMYRAHQPVGQNATGDMPPRPQANL